MFDERLSAYGIRVQEEDVHWDLSEIGRAHV